MIILKVVVLAALVRVLIITNRPLLCAGIYVSISFVFSLLSGSSFVYLLIASAISFGLAFLYFWLLDRFEESVMFWVILVVGLLVGVV
jgi:hypothetical protein